MRRHAVEHENEYENGPPTFYGITPFRNPHSEFRTPNSAFRIPHSYGIFPFVPVFTLSSPLFAVM